MTRKLYVHVGPRKTATSTIQRALATHGNSVVVYPGAGQGLGGPGQLYGHHGLVFGFFGNHGDARSMFAAIGEEAKRTDKNLLISAEVLESKNVGEFIGALTASIGLPVEVELIFACREHFSRAASLYNHRLRRRRAPEVLSPDDFLRECGGEVCYAPLMQNLRSTGYRITALNYHPSDTWLDRFFAHIGFPPDRIPRIDSELLAFSTKMIVVKRAVIHIAKSEHRQSQLMRTFKRMPGVHGPCGFIFGDVAAHAAESNFAIDRSLLRDEFGIELEPPKIGNGTAPLRISAADLADISAAAHTLGDEGRAIVEYACNFVS